MHAEEDTDAQGEAVDTLGEVTGTRIEVADTQGETVDTQIEAADTQGEAVDTRIEVPDTQSEAAYARIEAPETRREAVYTQIEEADDILGGPADAQAEAADAQGEIGEFRYTLEHEVGRILAPPMLAPDPATLERFLAVCDRRRYAPRDLVIQPGDAASTLYYVIEGSLSVSSVDEENRELILAYLSPGSFIGEMGLFMESPRREVIVRTRAWCELAEISYERLFSLFEGPLHQECPKILFAIGLQLTNRLLHTSRRASRLAFMDVASRIAKTLLDLVDEPNAQIHPQGRQVRISRQELSRIVGCSREMVGRVFKQLESKGMILVSGKTVVVLGER